jgi:kynureninase
MLLFKSLHRLDPISFQLKIFWISSSIVFYKLETYFYSTEGDSIALVLFSGVQYYTGQFFEMETITNAAKAKVQSLSYSIHLFIYRDVWLAGI